VLEDAEAGVPEDLGVALSVVDEEDVREQDALPAVLVVVASSSSSPASV
jgi:hypothetical protein